MDIKEKAKYLATVALGAIKNDEDLARAMEEGLKELEKAEVGSSGQSGV